MIKKVEIQFGGSGAEPKGTTFCYESLQIQSCCHHVIT